MRLGTHFNTITQLRVKIKSEIGCLVAPILGTETITLF